MTDARDTQNAKIAMMLLPEERVLARAFWTAQRAYHEREDELSRYYARIVHACKTKSEGLAILERIPDSVAKAFLIDYVEHARDWSRPHPKVER